MKMIEPLQVQIIHTAVTKLGMDDDDYRTILQGHYKKKSSKELTYVQASNLIDYFKTLGFKIPPRKRATANNPAHYPGRRGTPAGNVFVLPTREQLDMIDALVAKIAWRLEGGFNLWMKKYLKIDRIKSLSDAQRVIEGLKKMLEHQGEAQWKNG